MAQVLDGVQPRAGRCCQVGVHAFAEVAKVKKRVVAPWADKGQQSVMFQCLQAEQSDRAVRRRWSQGQAGQRLPGQHREALASGCGSEPEKDPWRCAGAGVKGFPLPWALWRTLLAQSESRRACVTCMHSERQQVCCHRSRCSGRPWWRSKLPALPKAHGQSSRCRAAGGKAERGGWAVVVASEVLFIEVEPILWIEKAVGPGYSTDLWIEKCLGLGLARICGSRNLPLFLYMK